jgi:hypothetical protein
LSRIEVRVMSSRFWLAFVFVASFWAEPAGAEPASTVIDVTLDQAKIAKLPHGTTTLVLGNPTFADVTPVRGTDAWVITAKGFGETNLIALSADGAVLDEKELRVLRPKTVLVLQKGDSRVSLACNPDCMPTMQLGDDDDHFSKTGTQITLRNSQAQGASSAVAGK